MKKKISVILSILMVFTILFNAGNNNSYIAKAIVKKTQKKVVTTKKKAIVKKPTASKKPAAAKKAVVVKAISSDKAIEGGVNWIKKQIENGDYKINDWYVVALSLAGEKISSENYLRDGKGYLDYKKETIKDEVGSDKPVAGYAKNILGLMSAGYDPTYFEGHDLLQEISKRVEKGDDTVTGQVWGMIALSASGTDYNRNAAAAYLESKQNKDGGYGWMPGTPSDGDTTAMAVYALTMCGKNKNTNSVKNALTYLKNTLKSMEKDKSKENVETIDQILMAVISAGDNLNAYKINGKSLVNEIVGFRNNDGGFKHDKSGSSNGFSTYQTVIALEFLKHNKNTYYDLKNNITNAIDTVTADIRVEGTDKTIINKEIKLNNRIVYDYNGKSYDTQKISVYAYLMKALNENNISSISDYSYGSPYVSTINGIKGGKYGGWDGWMFLVNGADPGKGMTDVEIKNGDKIVVFYGDYGILPIEIQMNTSAAVNQYTEVKATVAGKPAKGISIFVDGVNRGLTNESGILSFKFEKAGEVNVYGENNDSNGKPLNIRSEVSKVTVK